ncbi:hypothetical protein [Bacillus sp. T33-2]|uniref:hypothetical protein n=1 Tax=Bacillus sp. T33-2 TaxID=2054168 RepID=UPI000C787297|nr:hypothetical protein [Bacillus sp. T33-2]PLR94472.1 hypothetical protein CVD19_17450 [Bacillus sp. T33-2]
MDRLNNWHYNKRKINIGVIDMSQLQAVLDKLAEPQHDNAKKVNVTAIRNKLSVTTLPGNSLVDLYKEGK